MVLLAGRVAEEIIFDTITTGAGNDIERATGMARKMVCEWGMSDVVGPMTIGEQGEEVFIGRDWGHARNYSEDTARIVDAEIKKLVETARENCHKLLQENMMRTAVPRSRNLRPRPCFPLTRGVKPSSWKRNRLRMADGRKRRTKPNSSKRLAPASCGCRGIQLY